MTNEDRDPISCTNCHALMTVEFGDEPTEECHSCAHELLAEKRLECDAIEKMYRVEQTTVDRLKYDLKAERALADQLAKEFDALLSEWGRGKRAAVLTVYAKARGTT